MNEDDSPVPFEFRAITASAVGENPWPDAQNPSRDGSVSPRLPGPPDHAPGHLGSRGGIEVARD